MVSRRHHRFGGEITSVHLTKIYVALQHQPTGATTTHHDRLSSRRKLEFTDGLGSACARANASNFFDAMLKDMMMLTTT